MAPWRVVLLVLPQAWVAHAYSTFHAAAMAVPAAAIESTRFGVLVDSMAVIAVGWLTLAADLLIAAALLRYAAKRDVRTVRDPTRPPGPPGPIRPSAAGASAAPRRAALAGLEACPRVIETTPLDGIAPRRAR